MGRKKGANKRNRYSRIFRFGVDETPPWMDSFIKKNYAIPCSAKSFGPNNKRINQKWLYIQNKKKQLASKGDLIILTKSGSLIVSEQK